MNDEAERDKHPPLYSGHDIEGALSLFETLEYSQQTEIFSDIKLTLRNAGHILGSAL